LPVSCASREGVLPMRVDKIRVGFFIARRKTKNGLAFECPSRLSAHAFTLATFESRNRYASDRIPAFCPNTGVVLIA
jgi:hypothetical protein